MHAVCVCISTPSTVEYSDATFRRPQFTFSQLRFKVTGGGEAPPLLFSGGGGGEAPPLLLLWRDPATQLGQSELGTTKHTTVHRLQVLIPDCRPDRGLSRRGESHQTWPRIYGLKLRAPKC